MLNQTLRIHIVSEEIITETYIGLYQLAVIICIKIRKQNQVLSAKLIHTTVI